MMKNNISGTKHDQHKTRFELVDPTFVEGVASVLTFGALKYDEFNWAKGIKFSRVIGALKRHIHAFEVGENLDPETGQPHLYHAACNLMFLAHYMKHKKELDDRFFANVGDTNDN